MSFYLSFIVFMTMRYALLLTLALIILPQLKSQSYENLSYSAVWSVKYVQHLRRLNSNLGSASKDFNIETLLAFYRLTKCNKPQVCGTSFKGHWICSEEILDL